MKISLRVIGVMGVALFAILFGFTYGVPDAVEESSKGFVKVQIEQEIRQRYQSSKASTLEEKAVLIAEKLGYEEQQIRENIRNKLPEKIAEVVASMCGYDCEKKKQLTKSITAGYMERIANIQVAQQRLASIIKKNYMEIVGKLMADLRIFLGSNGFMFGVLLLVSFQKPRAIAHLYLPAVFLLVSTVVSSAIYLFGQDWFYTILYNDYMGFGYLAYIGVIFGFLMDITFNKARLTSEVINTILQMIGSVLSVAPC